MTFFFFNDTATTEIYTLSLHDALPICELGHALFISTQRDGRAPPVEIVLQADHLALHVKPAGFDDVQCLVQDHLLALAQGRKSTRLNSSHLVISYAVFCLKKKNTNRPL